MFKDSLTPIAIVIWIVVGILNTIWQPSLLTVWLSIGVIIFLLYVNDKSMVTTSHNSSSKKDCYNDKCKFWAVTNYGKECESDCERIKRSPS